MARLIKNLQELYRYRVLVQNLVSRELKARYRGTVLGFLWSFFNPLLLMIIYTIVFGFILPNRSSEFGNSPWLYALFLFSGVLPWVWFSSSSIESANVLMIHGNLIKKILFPAEVLPVVTVTSNLVHFSFGLPILLLFVLIFGKPFTLYVLLLPVVVLVQYIFALSFSFLLSALTVHFRDIQNILSHVLQLWFFATPVLYFYGGIHGAFRTVLRLNPMAHVMVSYQQMLFHGGFDHYEGLALAGIAALVTYAIGAFLFDRLRDTLAEGV